MTTKNGASGYLSKEDFFKGVEGRPEDLEVPGLGRVQVRPLEMVEVRGLYQEYQQPDGKVNNMDLMIGATLVGLVKPNLDKADLERLRKASGGKFLHIANRILALSGMTDDEELGKKVGGGS